MRIALALLIIPISGCMISANTQQQLDQKVAAIYAPSRNTYIRPQSPLSGTYYITYAPADFNEPQDVRDARDRQICALIQASIDMQCPTLKHVEGFSADYEVSYDYSAFPAVLGRGYDLEMDVKVRHGDIRGPVVWSAEARMPDQQSSDIAPMLESLCCYAMQGFPN